MRTHLSRSLVVGLFALLAGACSCGDQVASEPPAIPDATRATVSVDRAEGVVADGKDPVQITVNVLDKDGKPVANVPVTIAVSGEGNVLGEAAPSDASGVSTVALTSTRAQLKTITASIKIGEDLVELAQKPTVNFVPGAASKLVFSIPPSSVKAGSAMAPAVQLTV
ncbi:MAG: Ig-like domain-containing protein, partial [Myxococcales bacterium]